MGAGTRISRVKPGRKGALARRPRRPSVCMHTSGGRKWITCRAAVFANGEALECSFVANGPWHRHQRQELETDLIAAHVLTTGLVPPAQFIG